MQEFSISQAREYNDNILKSETFIISGYCDYNLKQRNEKYRYAQLINFDGTEKITILEGKDVLLAGVFYRLKVKPYIQKSSNELALKVIEVVNEEENDFIYNYKHFSVIKKKLEKGAENINEYFDHLFFKEKTISLGIITLKNSVACDDIEEALFEGNKKYIKNKIINVEELYSNFEEIKRNENEIDIWIITRGGGNLSFFNSYKFLEKISSLEKPIISALGHSTDYTLTDFIADRVFITPTAFGEYLNKILNINVNRHKQNKILKEKEENEKRMTLELSKKKKEIENLKTLLASKEEMLRKFENINITVNEMKESLDAQNEFIKSNGLFENISPNVRKFIYAILVLVVIKIILI